MKTSGGSYQDTGNFGTLLGLGTEDGGFSKCAIGHVRTAAYDVGDIVFLTRNSADAVSCDMTNERLRINSSGDTIISGNVAIGYSTPFSYRLYVNGVSYLDGNLKCAGIGNIHNNSPYAVPNNYMAAGSLTIGGTSANYGTATNWSSSTAGLMMECADYTEICVHDSGTRIASLMYYDGPSNQIYIGRDKYWGSTNTTMVGNATVNNSMTAAKYYVAGETYSFNSNWNGTGASGWFVSLNQFWYTGHAYLKVAIYAQNIGGYDNSNCWFGRILLSTNNNGTAPASPGGIGGSECGRDRPGFGGDAVSEKLRRIQYYRVLNIINLKLYIVL
jgi:hypothetical protein